MNHLHQSTKLTSQTLVTQRFKSDNIYQLRLNRSVENLIRPFDQPKLIKFKKDRFQRKQTSTTMLTQTQQKMPKALLKTSNKFNRSVIFEDEQTTNYKRLVSPGTFHSLSLQSRQQFIKSRSRQDIGAEKNRKKQSIFKDKSNDPILIGEAPSTKRVKLQVINQEGRQRQNGQRVREQLIWEKVKPKTYLERFRAQRNIK